MCAVMRSLLALSPNPITMDILCSSSIIITFLLALHTTYFNNILKMNREHQNHSNYSLGRCHLLLMAYSMSPFIPDSEWDDKTLTPSQCDKLLTNMFLLVTYLNYDPLDDMMAPLKPKLYEYVLIFFKSLKFGLVSLSVWLCEEEDDICGTWFWV